MIKQKKRTSITQPKKFKDFNIVVLNLTDHKGNNYIGPAWKRKPLIKNLHEFINKNFEIPLEKISECKINFFKISCSQCFSKMKYPLFYKLEIKS